jgi:DNA-binding Lrp family transcriptional regulator
MTDAPLRDRLINDYQRGFPLEGRPFLRVAADLGSSEAEVLAVLADLRDEGVLSRIGPVVRPNSVGASTLAAMAVPSEDLDRVGTLVSRFDEVNHCYEREHDLNLWFVVTAADRADVERVIAEISAAAGTEVIDLPLLEEYHIDLGFDLRCR